VTIAAHDVALCHLRHDPSRACPSDHPGHSFVFCRGLAMVELHDEERKPLTAVGARNVAKAA
jgi:hypothetical protein